MRRRCVSRFSALMSSRATPESLSGDDPAIGFIRIACADGAAGLRETMRVSELPLRRTHITPDWERWRARIR